jgi:hypothetical protein
MSSFVLSVVLAKNVRGEREREREREREQWETYTTSQGEDVCGFDVLYMRRGRAHYQTGHTSAHNILAAKMC